MMTGGNDEKRQSWNNNFSWNFNIHNFNEYIHAVSTWGCPIWC